MRFGIIGNLDKAGLPEAAGHLLERLEGSGTDYVIDKRILGLLGSDKNEQRLPRGRDFDVCVAEADLLVAVGTRFVCHLISPLFC